MKALHAGTGPMGSIVGPNGELDDPCQRFLIPSAKAKLEEAQMLYPQREGESHSNWITRLTQMLTANDPEEVFIDAARQIIEAYGVESIAERMRVVGDDHFAAGSFSSASHCYTAGIEKHSHDLGDSAQLMHCHVNRAAAHLKLGNTQKAVEDSDAALAIAEGCYAPKTQRKALLRRAQAFFELGRLDAAREDLEKLGPEDDAAKALLKRLDKQGAGQESGQVV